LEQEALEVERKKNLAEYNAQFDEFIKEIKEELKVEEKKQKSQENTEST